MGEEKLQNGKPGPCTSSLKAVGDSGRYAERDVKEKPTPFTRVHCGEGDRRQR